MTSDALLIQALTGEAQIMDVSSYVGPIDVAKMEKYVDGTDPVQLHGAIVRIADGSKPDTRGVENCVKLDSLGLPIGVYGAHYIRASATSNKSQATKFVQQYDAVVAAIKKQPQLGAYGDWEKDPDNLSIAQAREAIWKYIHTWEEPTGEELGHYSNAWWDGNVANPTNGATDIPKGVGKPGYKPKGRRHWAASWYSKVPYICWDYTQRYGQGCHVLHQYTNIARFDGINASVDLSTFNGTLAEYVSYFGLDGIPLPPPTPKPPEEFNIYNCTWLNGRPVPNYILNGHIVTIKAGETVKNMNLPSGEWERVRYEREFYMHKKYLEPVP